MSTLTNVLFNIVNNNFFFSSISFHSILITTATVTTKKVPIIDYEDTEKSRNPSLVNNFNCCSSRVSSAVHVPGFLSISSVEKFDKFDVFYVMFCSPVLPVCKVLSFLCIDINQPDPNRVSWIFLEYTHILVVLSY